MLTRMQHEILRSIGQDMDDHLRALQSEQELFASAYTLARVEGDLLLFAQTLAHLPDPLRQRLVQVDWHGWACLQDLLESDTQPRRAEVWYGTQSLVPTTLQLIARLRRQEPVWFELGY